MRNISPTELEVDYYDNITDLYKAITESDWDEAIRAVEKRPQEARTWVVRKHEENPTKNMWRFLPIHSACEPSKSIRRPHARVGPRAVPPPPQQGWQAFVGPWQSLQRNHLRHLLHHLQRLPAPLLPATV